MRERPDGVEIRLAERRDAPGIRAIYNHYVAESTALFDMVPRTLEEQVRWLDEHSGGHPAVVAELDGVIVGFGSLSRFRSRPAYATTVEDSVYLESGYQGRGIGRRLLDELLKFADGGVVYLEVRTDNEPAIALYRSAGFDQVGLRRRYYRVSGADAYTMRRDPH